MQRVIDTFELPEEIALELTEVMTKNTIRMNLLMNVTGDQVKYEEAEALLIPITKRFEALKLKVTRDFVPEKYKSSDRYIWNYNGYEMAKNLAEIIDTRAE